MTRYIKLSPTGIHQGDILRDIEYLEDAFLEEDEVLGISYIEFPYVVVLSQDCDLLSDLRARQNEPPLSGGNEVRTDTAVESILVCPAYDTDLFVAGDHLRGIDLVMQSWKTSGKGNTKWERLTQNRDQRYHFLSRSSEIGMSDMIIDFKHFYTISRHKLYKKYEDHYVMTIAELYREQLSQRFAYFLSRIGLPDEV